MTGIILWIRLANERWRYNVTSSLIGWAHTQNDLWMSSMNYSQMDTNEPGHLQLCKILTHWSWDKMAAILQTKHSTAFPKMKMYEFPLKFHWSLFPRIQKQLTIYSYSWALVKIMAWRQATSHYLNQWWLSLLTHMYASLGCNDLTLYVLNFKERT